MMRPNSPPHDKDDGAKAPQNKPADIKPPNPTSRSNRHLMSEPIVMPETRSPQPLDHNNRHGRYRRELSGLMVSSKGRAAWYTITIRGNIGYAAAQRHQNQHQK
ncbi:hypothetical protein BQ8794_110284 [Mesorhizobium prunaredense]|uniref:Uncharacterized protein n=1 Tax=Mesorhizobium prunaredense TaxID=1631249 RepID=A0A1R3V0S4_9HYPH|nr:hypothetical protein BQ8794_110284 [Mesorhizobium prunaredense]